jgi:hypothetical protein
MPDIPGGGGTIVLPSGKGATAQPVAAAGVSPCAEPSMERQAGRPTVASAVRPARTRVCARRGRSLSILHLGKLVEEAGFPAGTVQILPGLGEVTGEELTLHPGVHKVSFTGSTESAGASRATPRPTSPAPPSSLAASPRRSCSTTPTSDPRSRASRWGSSPTRARCAPQARL